MPQQPWVHQRVRALATLIAPANDFSTAMHLSAVRSRNHSRWDVVTFLGMGGTEPGRAEKIMPASTQLVPRPDVKPPKRQTRIKRQIDLYSLTLEVQTLSMVLNDLRGRVTQLEHRFDSDKIRASDRAMLSNLDGIFEKANSSPVLLLNAPLRRPTRSR
jgi:hypothetical protein